MFQRIWGLTRIAVSGPDSLMTLGFLAIVIGLELASIWISLRFIAWNADFFNALEDYDVNEALYQTGFYFALTAVSALRFLLSSYLRKFIQMNWRTRLTDYTISRWLTNKSYWKLREGLSPVALENPDQRISEDCRLFVSGLLNETLDLFTRIVGIFSYVAVLWALTNFALKFTLFGTEYTITHYLVWVAFIYVLVSSFITHFLGWPLKNLLFDQERREAEFRYALIRLRENASEIAMSSGEESEKSRFDKRFADIVLNWRKLIGREFIVGLFTRPYFQTVLRIPLFLSLPSYLAREVTLGGLMQLASAFSNVTTTLSWFIFSYRDLADFVATSERLGGLLEDLENSNGFEQTPQDIKHKVCGKSVVLKDLDLYTPKGKVLLKIPSLEIKQGERVWLHAPSGTGKTTLLRVIAGIWPFGKGVITVPDCKSFFASQNPYLVKDGLGPSLFYPAQIDESRIPEIKSVLQRVGLQDRIQFLEEDGAQALEGMSSGEMQRLVFARILLSRPQLVVIDEIASALNKGSAEKMYQLLARSLPEATIICVAHHVPDGLEIDREISLERFSTV
ncbi:MAG: SbmA/BacA-like family transporter [Pseudomonadota bacterium]